MKANRVIKISAICCLFSFIWANLPITAAIPNENDHWKRVQEKLTAELHALNVHPQKPGEPFSSYINGNFYFGSASGSITMALPAWKRTKGTVQGEKPGQVDSIGTGNKVWRAVTLGFTAREFNKSQSDMFVSQMAYHEKRFRDEYELKSWKLQATGLNQRHLTSFNYAPVYRVATKDISYAGFSGKKVVLSVEGTIAKLAGLIMLPNGDYMDLYMIASPTHPEHIIAGFAFQVAPQRHFFIQIHTSGNTFYRPEIPFPSETLIDQIMSRIATILSSEFGKSADKPVEEKFSDCGKAGALTRYIEGLRRQRQNLMNLNGELDWKLGGPKPDHQAVIDMGVKARSIAAEFQKTLREFAGAETRRGLLEELDLIFDSVMTLNQVAEKYQKLAGVAVVPLQKSILANAKGDVARAIFKLAREEVAARLESEGLRDILTSESWNEVLDKTAYHSQRKLDEFLDRETEKVFGLGFHDAASARRALQVQLRREIRRQVARLLVKITSNEIVIEIVAGPIIRWIERDLIPRLREALRQKGNLPKRVARSVETLENARDELHRLTCADKLREVRRRLAAAMGAIAASRYLARDLMNARADREAALLNEALKNLENAMKITRVRFLLVMDDYEDDLAFADFVVAQMLDNLLRAIPAGAQDARGGSGVGRQKLRLKKEAPPRIGLEIPNYEARVSGFRFFEGGKDAAAMDQRQYGTRFSRVKSRFIYWELRLDHQGIRTKHIWIEAIYFNPDGSEMNRHSQLDYVVPEFPEWPSLHSRGYGWETPGNWAPGKYRVELHIKETKAAEGEFEIF
jgi:hypothetical protein